MKKTMLALFGAAAIFLASCETKEVETTVIAEPALDMDAVRAEIQALEDGYAAAESAKDAAGVANYYAENATSFMKGNEPVVGKAAIQAKIAERLAKDTTAFTDVYKIVDLYAEGDMVVEIGSWKHLNAAQEELDHGFYMAYFEKTDAGYRCVRDMSMSAVPEKKAE